MARNTNEILAAELQKLAEKTTKAVAKEDTGSAVVGWVAKKLPDDAFQLTLQTPTDPAAALRTAHAVLEEKGCLCDDLNVPPDVATVAAVVGSGFLGFNPAVVTVQVIPCDDGSTELVVTGAAKEGLIKQHAGEKAARAVAEHLQQRLGTLR